MQPMQPSLVYHSLNFLHQCLRRQEYELVQNYLVILFYQYYSHLKTPSRSSDVLGTDCTDLTSTSIVSSSTFGSTIASTFDSTIESTLESTSLETSCFSSFFSSRLEGFSSESKIASFSSVVGSSITSIGKFFSLRLSSASISAPPFYRTNIISFILCIFYFCSFLLDK